MSLAQSFTARRLSKDSHPHWPSSQVLHLCASSLLKGSLPPSEPWGQLNTSMCRRGNQGTERNLSLLAAEPGKGLRPLASPSRAPPAPHPRSTAGRKARATIKTVSPQNLPFSSVQEEGTSRRRFTKKEKEHERSRKYLFLQTDSQSSGGPTGHPSHPFNNRNVQAQDQPLPMCLPSHQVCSNLKHLT